MACSGLGMGAVRTLSGPPPQSNLAVFDPGHGPGLALAQAVDVPVGDRDIARPVAFGIRRVHTGEPAVDQPPDLHRPAAQHALVGEAPAHHGIDLFPHLVGPRHHPNQGRRQHHAGLDQALPRWRLRGPLPQAARRPRPAPADAALEVAHRLVGLKADNPTWSVRSVIRAAIEDGIDHPLAASTVHRLFSREGLFDRKPPDGADRRRFAFRDAGELWMSDVMHGPKVRHGKSRRKTYLIAFIDDATRIVPFAAFDTTGNVLDIYKAIAWELGLTVERSRSSAHHAIRTEISRLAKEARQLPVLVIDEAHHLRNDVLEDLRLLTNFAMDSENRMCLILVGLTELRRRLAMAVHESLSQRLVVRHHLSLSLDGEVTSGMVGLDWSRDSGSRLGGRDRSGSGAGAWTAGLIVSRTGQRACATRLGCGHRSPQGAPQAPPRPADPAPALGRVSRRGAGAGRSTATASSACGSGHG